MISSHFTIVKSLDLQDSVQQVMMTQTNQYSNARNTSYDQSEDGGHDDMEIAHYEYI